MNDLNSLLQATLADPEIPAAVRGFLSKGARLDDLRLDSFGRWSFNGAAVEHPRVARLFTQSLRRTDAGTWILEVGRYTYPVTVEGASCFIRRLEVRDTEWHGETTGGASIDLSGSALVSDGDTFVGAVVGERVARFVESAHQTVLSWMAEDDRGGLVARAPDGTRALRIAECPWDMPPIS